MARYKGSYISTVYDTSKRFPLDARMLVSQYSDLINPSIWKTAGQSEINGLFNGLLTVVTEEGKRGLYCLLDRTQITEENYLAYLESRSRNEPLDNYFSMWERYASLSEIEALLDDMHSSYATYEYVDDAIREIQRTSSVETYAYRELFPLEGVEGTLYAAVDENKTYVWYVNDYVPVGADYTAPDIIFGGTAD